MDGPSGTRGWVWAQGGAAESAVRKLHLCNGGGAAEFGGFGDGPSLTSWQGCTQSLINAEVVILGSFYWPSAIKPCFLHVRMSPRYGFVPHLSSTVLLLWMSHHSSQSVGARCMLSKSSVFSILSQAHCLFSARTVFPCRFSPHWRGFFKASTGVETCTLKDANLSDVFAVNVHCQMLNSCINLIYIIYCMWGNMSHVSTEVPLRQYAEQSLPCVLVPRHTLPVRWLHTFYNFYSTAPVNISLFL